MKTFLIAGYFVLSSLVNAQISAENIVSLCVKELLSDPVTRVGVIRDPFKGASQKNMVYNSLDKFVAVDDEVFHDVLKKAEIVKSKNYYNGEDGYFIVVFGEDDIPKYALYQNPKYGDDMFDLYFCHAHGEGVRLGGRLYASASRITAEGKRSERILAIYLPTWKKTGLYKELFKID